MPRLSIEIEWFKSVLRQSTQKEGAVGDTVGAGALEGAVIDGLPVFDAPAHKTPGGVAYFTSPGVVVLAHTVAKLGGANGFLSTFPEGTNFVEYTSDPDVLPPAASLCKFAGQLCYLSLGPGRTMNANADKYFENIKVSGHGSVLEHASFSFLLYGVSRSFTHELVRHRAGTAFSQLSQRYVDAKALRFVERPEYQESSSLHQRFLDSIERASQEYSDRIDELLEMQKSGEVAVSAESKTDRRKRVQQAARASLPNETEAPIVFSANARALRHVIEMRCSEHAESEMRGVFARVLLCVQALEPTLFGDYSLTKLEDGSFAAATPYRKV